ncbi:hypothetical protein HNR46_001930 [Haloferula luteola]|uniref:HAD family phosphatase n=1 Tax=Haloferula luteola TaxID=595692 RepID=A0A840VFW6_9BACT|nr:Cof-type HAD-IIB family hydrolase [Haloferula luteola]MBB5351691.1 hypothetical protein [Haloferula luteola]
MRAPLKLAAIDLDGTLLSPDKTISAENLAALQQLREAGLEIVVATGRHITRIGSIMPFVPDARWVVTCQGAAAHSLQKGESIHSVHLTPEEANLILKTGEQLGFSCIIYAEDQVRTLGKGPFIDFYGAYAGGMPQASSPAELEGLRIHKLIWLGEEGRIDGLPELPEVKAIPLYQIRTHEWIYEFLPRQASKAVGVAAVADLLGIKAEEVVAFGDADNDIPLFQWAGHSFAMPHGMPTAREAAHEIAPVGPPESAFARAVATLHLVPCTLP